MLLAKYFLVLLALLALFIVVRMVLRYVQNERRKKLYAAPLKSEWLDILKAHVPLSNALPKALQELYHGHINYFIATKEFVGRGGFEVTDKERVIIAGNACLMVLTRTGPVFPGFKTIIVYPQTYTVPTLTGDSDVVSHDYQHRAGESWHRGPIVLAWSDVIGGSQNSEDARNVVIHEFAHKLDEENQLMDGLPILKDRSHYKAWAEVLTDEYQAFLERVEKRENRVIDSYGAVSPVEFFAVISESFFEKPSMMKKRLPALYEQLRRYYGVDVAEW